jgi:hypothetical protein
MADLIENFYDTSMPAVVGAAVAGDRHAGIISTDAGLAALESLYAA